MAYDAAGNVSGQSNTASATTQAPITTGSITGTIYSAATFQPINQGKVSLYLNKKTINTYYTDSKGVYLVTNVPVGTYSVKYSATGHTTKTVNVQVVAGNTTVQNAILNMPRGKNK